MRFRVPVPGSGDAGVRIGYNNDPDNDNSDEEELAFDYANHAPLEVVQHPRIDYIQQALKFKILNTRFRQLCFSIEQYLSIRPSTSQSKCTASNGSYFNSGQNPSFMFGDEPSPASLAKKYNSRRNRSTILYNYEKLFILDNDVYDQSSIPPYYNNRY